jgi:hypothetical protein
MLTMIELPAVNTPQFDWARTHMARRPRPVAPVVQPEAIAETVFGAANNPKREYWLGFSTVKAILANTIWPAFLDRYLAKNVYSAQEQPMLVSPDRRDNLMTPVSGLHRTQGSFDDEARRHVIAVSGPVARFVPILAGVAAGVIGGIFLCLVGRGLAPRSPSRVTRKL